MSPKMKTCLSLEATSRRSIAQIEVESQVELFESSAFPQDPDATRFIQELADAKPHVLNAGR